MKLQIADCRLQIDCRLQMCRRAQRFRRLQTCCRVLVCGLVLAGGSRAVVASEIIDRVLAVAAGNLIMLSDVTAALEFGLVVPGPSPDPVRDTLTRLIDRAIILAEVERYAPPEPDADAVDRELQAVRSGFASPQAFDEALARVGVNAQHLRETLRQNLRIRAYLDQRFTVATPTDEELGRYYREHQQEFSRNGATVPFDLARQIVVQAVRTERRRMLVDDWVAGLRRRTEIVDMYQPKT
jgi:hypothetical protein